MVSDLYSQMFEGGGFDPASMPKYAKEQSTWNPFSSAISGIEAGAHGFLGGVGGAAQAAGRATGVSPVEQWGAGLAQSQRQAESAAAIPEYEAMPWQDKGVGLSPKLVPWATYQLGKAAPTIAAWALGGAAAGKLGLVPKALEEYGATAPAFLGGGAGLEGEAAAAAGKGFAQNVVGAAAANYLPGAGELYSREVEKAHAEGREPTRGEAVSSLVGGAPYAALGAVQAPTLFKGAHAGTLAARVLTGAGEQAVVAGPQMGLQTALAQEFGPPKTIEERSREIVQAALGGAAVGGLVGGAFGAIRNKPVGQVSKDDLSAVTEPLKEGGERPPTEPFAKVAAPPEQAFSQADKLTLWDALQAQSDAGAKTDPKQLALAEKMGIMDPNGLVPRESIGVPNAVQESSAAGVDAQKPSGNGEGVGGGNPGGPAPGAGQEVGLGDVGGAGVQVAPGNAGQEVAGVPLPIDYKGVMTQIAEHPEALGWMKGQANQITKRMEAGLPYEEAAAPGTRAKLEAAFPSLFHPEPEEPAPVTDTTQAPGEPAKPTLDARMIVDKAVGEAPVVDPRVTLENIKPVLDAPSQPVREGSGPAALSLRVDQTATQAAGVAQGLVGYLHDKMNLLSDMGSAARRLWLYAAPNSEIATHYQRWFGPAVQDFYEAHGDHDAISGNIHRIFWRSMTGLNDVIGGREAYAKQFDKLASWTMMGVDPRLPYEKQPWLPQTPQMKALVGEANGDWSRWRQSARGAEAYNNHVATQDALYTLMHAQKVFNVLDLLYKDTGITKDAESPLRKLQFDTEAQFDLGKLTALAHSEWGGLVTRYTDYIQPKYADALVKDGQNVAWQKERAASIAKGVEPGDGPEMKKVKDANSDLSDILTSVQEKLGSQEREPYFHVGRGGDFMVAARMKTAADGSLDPVAGQAFMNRLALAGLDDVAAINMKTGNPDFFARVSSPSQRAELHRVIQAAFDAGELDKTKQPISGYIGNPLDLTGRMPQEMVRRIEALVEERMKPAENLDPITAQAVEAQRRDVKLQLGRLFMSLYPEKSIGPLMGVRKNVQGYYHDMVRNAAQYGQTLINEMSRSAVEPKLYNAISQMAGSVNDLKTTDPEGSIKAQDALSELLARKTTVPWNVQNTIWDWLRAMNHPFYLGLSPAYMITQLSALPLLTAPWLARKAGFVGAGKALAETTPMALQAFRAILSGDHPIDMSLEPDQLAKHGFSLEDRNFLMRVSNMGLIELGGFSRNLGRAGESELGGEGKLSRLMSIASATATGVETFSRMLTALAARKVWQDLPEGPNKPAGEEGMYKYVSEVVRKSQMDWATSNVPRAMGKQGFLGSFTPIATAFQGYHVRLGATLYDELTKALDKTTYGDEAQRAMQRQEARTFLAGHATATAMLAGTLGLPILGTAMGIATNVGNTLAGENKYDFEAAYRNWLRDSFGVAASNAISKGLPRLANIDLSATGDAEMIPGASLAIDRRKLEDAFPDWAQRQVGPPGSMLLGAAKGARDLWLGNYVSGMSELLPTTLRNLFTSCVWNKYGFVDQRGNKLPIDPTHADILMKALGLHPADYALSQEQRRTISEERETQQLYSANIKNIILRAASVGDKPALDRGMAMAQAWDQEPEHMQNRILPTIGQYLKGSQTRTATAKAYGMVGLPSGPPANIHERDIAHFAGP